MSKTVGIVLALEDKCSPKLKQIADKIGVTEKELKRANKTITDFSNKLGNGLANAAKVAGAGMLAVGAAIGATIAKTTEQGDKIDKMSQKMQMSRQTFQELDYVFSQNGADISIMQTGMSKLAKTMDGAKTGAKANVQTFQRLGISLRDTNGRMKTTENVMFEALDKLQKMPEGAEKSTLAMQLFGKSATELAPLLNGNAKSVSELRQKFNDLGMGMSDEAINASVRYKDTMESLNRSFQGIMYSVGAEFLPIVQSVADTIQNNMPQIRAAVMPVFQGIGNAIKFVANNLNILIPIATACVSAFVAFKVINGVITTIQTLRSVIQAVTVVQGVWNALMLANPIGLIAVGVGALIGAITLLVINWDKVTGAVKRAIEAVKNFLHIKPKNVKVETETTENKKVDGSHANGLSNVPFNGYIAELHKGERVLTANENKTYNQTTTNTNTNKQITVNFYGDIIGNGEFLNKIKQDLGAELKKAMAV